MAMGCQVHITMSITMRVYAGKDQLLWGFFWASSTHHNDFFNEGMVG